jgi:hypothetical protein
VSIYKKFVLVVIFFISALLVYPGESSSFAESEPRFQNARFILYFGKETYGQKTILTEKQIADFAFASLNSAYEEYSNLFNQKPEKKVTIRFLSPSEFKRYTGAPAWTSAMYFNDEITIPLNPKNGINLTDLGRAIKHEYAHAVIAEISDGKCPAWLDEGLAQSLEGRTNPLLGPALRKWISTNEAMPLSWLQNGFTLLNEELVPAAYAQSLFSTKKIINDTGYQSIGTYLKLLREGNEEKKSFKQAFQVDQAIFISSLSLDIKKWSRTREYNP